MTVVVVVVEVVVVVLYEVVTGKVGLLLLWP